MRAHRLPTAVPSLHVYLAGLCRALEPDRPARSPAKVVVTVAPGYALRLPAGALDAAAFDAAVTAAHRRLGGWSTAAGMPARPGRPPDKLAAIAAQLDGALGAWRGTPYTELGDLPAAVAELEELRLVARARVGDHEGHPGEADLGGIGHRD
jgi:hypothetical protein